MMDRSSGILLPMASLPSPHGIGTLGRTACEFVDFLAAAGQRWWQLLPVGPTGFGDSPYQSVSLFAGNPYFVDLDLLAADGLLTPAELAAPDWGGDAERIDYGKLWRFRLPLLRRAAERCWSAAAPAVERFTAENRDWLPDYALFTALHRHFEMRRWTAWPEDIRRRTPEALARWSTQLAGACRTAVCIQYLFDRQWTALHRHAAARGVALLGDLPIYAAPDSADVWAAPALFRLDDSGEPTAVAGVPPDRFSETGQLWGNPLYDWSAMAADGYGWWRRRAAVGAKRFDALRIDHFRGLASFWAVPRGAVTAREGHWEPGPGLPLLRALEDSAPGLKFIAEDLGILGPEVGALLRESGWPGMKVLEFAFDPSGDSDYLPRRHPENCVCYTGTHDNAPLAAWCAEAPPAELDFAMTDLGVSSPAALREAILRSGMESAAALFVAQMQDWLGTGAESRINTPGTAGGNWQWRLRPDALTPALAEAIAAETRRCGRSAAKQRREPGAGATENNKTMPPNGLDRGE